jgi:RNA polymerase sigma-70 factor (ECF subfamily)
MRLFTAVARGYLPSKYPPPVAAMSLRRYVATICSHALTDSLRRAQKRPETESLDLERHDVIDPRTELEANLLQGERRVLVREALSTLSAADRRLVQMYYLEGRTLADIAESLHIGDATVHRRQKEVIERLREFVLSKGG